MAVKPFKFMRTDTGWIIHGAVALLLAGCANLGRPPLKESSEHINPAGVRDATRNVPELAQITAIPAPPVPQVTQELLTLSVKDVPLDQLLMSLAQGQQLNVDIENGIDVRVTMNVRDQTLLQILDRLAQQHFLRYTLRGRVLSVVSDQPHLAHYPVDYVNIQRATTRTESSRDVGTRTTSGSASSTNTTNSVNYFWQTLSSNVCLIAGRANQSYEQHRQEMNKEEFRRERLERLRIATALSSSWSRNTNNQGGNKSEGAAGNNGQGNSPNDNKSNPNELMAQIMGSGKELNCSVNNDSDGNGAITLTNVLVNREGGMMSVITTSKGHAQIRQYIDSIIANARRQVMIEATVVEVNLNQSSEQGIQWDLLVTNGALRGTNFRFLRPNVTNFQNAIDPKTLSVSYTTGSGDTSALIKLLETFGQSRVLSSPKLSVLNNQTAQLKVVEDYVYTTISYTPGTKNLTTGIQTSPDTYTTNINTIPIGFSMSVTPQIAETGEVTLNVRPVISRVVRQVLENNPALLNLATPINNYLPVVQSREFESIMRVQSGEVAILGGLIQDVREETQSGLPVVSQLNGVGNLAKSESKTRSKSELVVFLRPLVVDDTTLSNGINPSSGSPSSAGTRSRP